ncbi:glutathione S-transferase [Sphingobium boeckii]|uniref:Glutathione S-transferase n=1 Tax=Sphingobium boeckii TaxID=1082345 RepID=A0A7W9AGZ3_9SPHN|nr:glutathione S-transferase [Sphingobium boeckii]MBB5685454.1 glutathione S-transferase [Sphingobium boeckii]
MSDPALLYSFRRCPYAMRARMALIVSGQPCIVREIVLRDKPAEMIAASAKATVPVLCLPDGTVIDQSLDIMRWALGRHDPEAWLGQGGDDLIAENDGAFKYHLDRYKYPERHASDPVAHRDAGLAILSNLEMRLAKSAHLCGENRSLADLAIMPFVRQFAATDKGWFDAQSIPRLRDWLTRHTDSPLFQQTMRRLTPWQHGDAETWLVCEATS